jgi:SAM-dependent methyltransferase
MNCNCTNTEQLDNVPHNQNALQYDFVFQRRFGQLLDRLTTINLELINEYLPHVNARILDFGAGTGRLAIPLAEAGHSITAVDASSGMLSVLENKTIVNPVDINCHLDVNCQRIPNDHDLAIAFFTVMAYLTTIEDLTKTMAAIYSKLKLNAYFIFDLEHQNQYNRFVNGVVPHPQHHDLTQEVRISFENTNPNIGYYQEKCSGTDNGIKFEYEENFNIMFWNINEVIGIAHKVGFQHVTTLSPISTADYIVLQKKP